MGLRADIEIYLGETRQVKLSGFLAQAAAETIGRKRMQDNWVELTLEEATNTCFNLARILDETLLVNNLDAQTIQDKLVNTSKLESLCYWVHNNNPLIDTSKQETLTFS